MTKTRMYLPIKKMQFSSLRSNLQMERWHSKNYLLMAITTMQPTTRICIIKRNIYSVCLEIVQVCLLY